MNTKLGSHSALLSLAPLAFAVVTTACGSAADVGPAQSPGPTVASAAQPASGAPAPSASKDGEGHRGHHRGERMFAKFDEDGDGKVTIADLPEHLRERAQKADANGDGIVTRDEFDAARAAHRAEMQALMDANGDGVVSDDERKAGRAEFEARMEKRFDTNHDGVVSDDERKAARAKFGGNWLERVDANHDGVVSDDERKALQAKFREMWMAKKDTNKDGAIEQSEVPSQAWARISVADANKDGKVDAAELATLPPPEHHRFEH